MERNSGGLQWDIPLGAMVADDFLPDGASAVGTGAPGDVEDPTGATPPPAR